MNETPEKQMQTADGKKDDNFAAVDWLYCIVVACVAAILEDLDTVADGGSAFRMISGRYGSGKSFLIQLMRAHAMERGFAVADADLSPERRLAGANKQGLATYRELMRNLSTRAAPDGGALPVVLTRWISKLQITTAQKQGLAPGSQALADAVELEIMQKIQSLETMVHGFDFAAAVRTFYRGAVDGDDERKQAALRWLRGEFATKTEAKAALPVSGIIEDASWYDYLKLIGELMKLAGHAGFVVFIDEAVNLYKITQSVSREANYEKLLNIFNDATQGRLSGLAFIFGATPQCIGSKAKIDNAFITQGAIVNGDVSHSVIFSGATVGEDAKVSESVIMNNVTVGKGTKLTRCLVADDVRIPEGMVLGKKNSDEILLVSKALIAKAGEEHE